MEWTREGLAAAGFRGFVRFADLQTVPKAPGVYVVLRDRAEDPTFLGARHAGRFKGKDPSVDVPTLQAAWVQGARVL